VSYFQYSNELPAWIGSPPSGWGTNWLKWHVRLSTERPTEEEAQALPYIANEDIESWTGKLLNPDPQPAAADSRKFQPDDVLFNKLRPYLAKVYHAPFAGVCSGELLCLRGDDEVLPRYLFYVVSSKAFVDAVNAETFGSKMPRADWETVGHQPLPQSPLKMQRRISAFLDEKTVQIDALIKRKRNLLDRLAEKRQATITQAVTKGLSLAAPMKESGIDWLGQVPAHWEVCGLGQKIKLQRGVDLTRAERVDGEYPVISSGGIEYFHDTALCPAPGVLVGRKGSAGKLHYSESPYWPHDTTLYVREFRENHPRFVWYLLHCLDLTSFDTGSSNPTVNRNRVHPMKTAWPPIREQIQIASYLDVALRKSQQVEQNIAQSINLLVEYRSAMITAAVTGHIEELR
jgi:type I restriction enzyme, S subunit